MTTPNPYLTPVRPPLTPREKSGARLAGILGFVLLSLGFGLVVIPVGILLFGAFFALVAEFVRRVSQNDTGFEQFMGGIESLNLTAWILPLVIVALVGLGVMTAALFVSARILRRHDVNRPWAVTWAGAGIAIVGSWFVSSLSAVPYGIISGMSDNDGAGIGLGIAVGVLSGLVGLATTAVIGWMSWWWMAHAFRRSATEVASPLPA